MDSPACLLDPPGTINPAKLLPGPVLTIQLPPPQALLPTPPPSPEAVSGFIKVEDQQQPINHEALISNQTQTKRETKVTASQNIKSTTTTNTTTTTTTAVLPPSRNRIRHRRLLRLPRISSDVDQLPRAWSSTDSLLRPGQPDTSRQRWLDFEDFARQASPVSSTSPAPDASCSAGSTKSGSTAAAAAASRAKTAMHCSYYNRQMLRPGAGAGQPKTTAMCFPVDPSAGPTSNVAVEAATHTIWDAYMLKVDVASNTNCFRRQQVVFDKLSHRYTLWVRDGDVGQQSHSGGDSPAGETGIIDRYDTSNARAVLSSPSLRVVAAKFRSLFSSATGQRWETRYADRRGPAAARAQRRENPCYEFVELDYHAGGGDVHHGDGDRPIAGDLPDYLDLDAGVVDEVKGLMELVLYGGSCITPRETRNSNSCNNTINYSAYTAPYHQLSHFAIFSGFKTLKHILYLLESGSPLKWKTMQRATSRYRSQIPHVRQSPYFTPVICSYQTVFLELRLLSAMWPAHPQISSAMIAACDRATVHWLTHGVLAQPLYTAYSSLRHGFRRLEDRRSAEWDELCGYLFGSNHVKAHRMGFEVLEIYRVFVKKGLENAYNDWIESGRSSRGKQQSSVDGDGDLTMTTTTTTTTVRPHRDAEERLLLWHGTPLDSLLGILDLGLQIRRRGANFTGTMFGNGIYLADSSSKSAGFCRHQRNANVVSTSSGGGGGGGSHHHQTNSSHHYNNAVVNNASLGIYSNTNTTNTTTTPPNQARLPPSSHNPPIHTDTRGGGGGGGAEAVLLLCEADVGANRLKSAGSIPQGHTVIEGSHGRRRSIQGVGQNGPRAWKGVGWDMEAAPAARAGVVKMPDTTHPYGEAYSPGCLRFNEYVVYDPSHLTIRYLFRIKIRGTGY